MKRTTDRNSRRDRWRMGIERDSESEKDEDGIDALPVSFDISRSDHPSALQRQHSTIRLVGRISSGRASTLHVLYAIAYARDVRQRYDLSVPADTDGQHGAARAGARAEDIGWILVHACGVVA